MPRPAEIFDGALVRRLVVLTLALLLAPLTSAQDLAAIVTRADVEKVTGLKFKEATYPMKTQAMFVQEGGDMQLSVSVEPREASQTVRGWEATTKRMRPGQRVDTVPGIGRDAIFMSTRPDSGALWADFDRPRVGLNIGVALARDSAQAKRIVVALARTVGPRIGK
jgi:hypothetical protein